jgi:hypothetical protein
MSLRLAQAGGSRPSDRNVHFRFAFIKHEIRNPFMINVGNQSASLLR